MFEGSQWRLGQLPHGDAVVGRSTLSACAWGKLRPSSVMVVRKRSRIRDIDSSMSSSQTAFAGAPVPAFAVIARSDT